jgi:hypothetical protein
VTTQQHGSRSKRVDHARFAIAWRSKTLLSLNGWESWAVRAARLGSERRAAVCSIGIELNLNRTNLMANLLWTRCWVQVLLCHRCSLLALRLTGALVPCLRLTIHARFSPRQPHISSIMTAAASDARPRQGFPFPLGRNYEASNQAHSAPNTCCCEASNPLRVRSRQSKG